MKKIITAVLLVISLASYSQSPTAKGIKVFGRGGGGAGGVSQLGISDSTLTRPNDSTYRADITILKTVWQARQDSLALVEAIALKANLASPPLTGNPTSPTQTLNDSSTKIATTAYVDRAGGNYVHIFGDEVIYDKKEFQNDIYSSGARVGVGGNLLDGNTLLGYNVLANNTPGGGYGIYNTAVGLNALSLNTIGLLNTAIGAESLTKTTTGESNVGVGSNSLWNNTTGYNNTAVGAGSLFNLRGYKANNTGIGANSLYVNMGGENNTALGTSSLTATQGSNSIAIGVYSGFRNWLTNSAPSSINNSILIGNETKVHGTNAVNQIVIGDSARSNGNNTTVIGNHLTLNTDLKGQLKLPSYLTRNFYSGDTAVNKPLVIDINGNVSQSYWAGSGGGSSAWGGITGTLSSQTDLQAALNLKLNIANPTMTGNGTISGSITAGSIVRSGGTSAQVLMANGTIRDSMLLRTAYPNDSTTINYYTTGWTDTLISRTDFKLTTIGSSGPAFLSANKDSMNIPNYVGGASAWGSITGTLSSQTDLQTALDLRKLNSDSVGNTGYATPFDLTKTKDSLQANVELKANDIDVVHLTGNETIAGVKTFTNNLIANSSVGVGTATPDVSARLDITSTTQGVLFPRLTSAQRDLITAPAVGLQIFNTTESYPEYFDAFWGWTPVYISNEVKASRFAEYFNDFGAANSANDGVIVSPVSGTGSGVASASGLSMANRTGVTVFNSGTTATGWVAIRNDNTNTSMFTRFGAGRMLFQSAVSVTNLSTSLERFQVVSGISLTNGLASPTSGVFFLYDEGGVSTGSTASTFWQVATCNSAGLRTITPTTVAVVAGDFYDFKIYVDDAGTSADFWINNVLVAANVTTTMPPTTVNHAMFTTIVKSVGTTSRSLQIDYTGFKKKYSTPH